MVNNATPIRAVKNMKPLYFHKGRLYCSRFNKIYTTSDFGASFTYAGNIDLKLKLSGLYANMPLIQRMLRAHVYRMRVLSNGNMVLVFRGGIYTLIKGEDRARLTFAVKKGSRPVSLAVSKEGRAVFGEYWSNPRREEVNIYGSDDFGRAWQVIYTFPRGSIRHVHGITYDRWEDCFWICSGDSDGECCLFRATTDFRKVETVLKGGQKNRFYSIYADKDFLIMANDTPVEKNYIYIYDKKTGKLQGDQAIENSSFYHCVVNGRIFVSTNAEPSDINDIMYSHVWYKDRLGQKWQRVLSFPTDFYSRIDRMPLMPNGLFQLPNVFFPDGENTSDTLACYLTGLKGYDNAMLCYDTSIWDR